MAYLGVQEKIFRTFYTIIIKIRILIFYVYQLDEIVTIINWLQKEFGTKWFPLANDVQKLGNGTEVTGLGVAILNHAPGDIEHAQGASYLGVVLDHLGVLKWNGRRRGIKWQIIKPNINKEMLVDLMG